MGVMSCSRKGCTNIMCDTYISDIGYVCSDCQLDFKEYLKNEEIEATTEGQIRKALKPFMNTRKEERYEEGKEVSVNDFFSNNTK